jgi:glycogen debranching enzyme
MPLDVPSTGVTSPRLVRLRARPDTLYLSHGRTVLATGRDGFVRDGFEHGLFVHETRLLSRHVVRVDGEEPQPNALSNVEQHSWLGYYLLPVPGSDADRDRGSGRLQAASQQSLELRVSRQVGEGMHEDLDITNFSQSPTHFTLDVELSADFTDLNEAAGERLQRGHTERRWTSLQRGGLQLEYAYRARHQYRHQDEAGEASLDRGVLIRIERASTAPAPTDSGVRFAIELPPLARWHACLRFLPRLDGRILEAPAACRQLIGPHGRRTAIFLSEATTFDAPGTGTLAPVVTGALEQAAHDLDSLRLPDLDEERRSWTMSAGLPMYVALFGRDTLTAAWQAALAGPETMRGTLAALQHWQGRERNDWRDEEPGRMLHEAHTGPLEVLNFNPRGRSYSSITTSAFFPVVVAELWHWTGNRELVRRHLDAARRALRWLDTVCDTNGHGFHVYQTHSKDGVRHQAWKDSGDAVVYEDGSAVLPPIATCEEQGFAYIGKLLLAEVLWWLGERDEARALLRAAQDLKVRFNDRFWLEEEAFVAFGLDAGGRPIRSITSNPGHCIAAGIVDDALVGPTADRLMQDDLFSGWGIRTLSARHPAYNPYSYHRGSVWPVEQATFVAGFVRFGLHHHAERLARGFFEAAALFDGYRLPELVGGHERDADHPFPGLYPQANSPQAWSASAVFCVVQSLLGLYPYAPLNALVIDPHLPEWLPELTLRNLRVGQGRVAIRFFRTRSGETDYRILDLAGRLHVVRQPSPWSLTASFGERLRDLIASAAPGR